MLLLNGDVGRQSREKRERRRTEKPWERDLRKNVGLKADRRGASIKPILRDVEDASSRRGESALTEFLIARANQRWVNVASANSRIPDQVFQAFAPVHLLDRFLLGTKVGCPENETWFRHLLVSLDILVNSLRMVLIGQLFGAAAMSRSQLERWTFNLAYTRNLTQEPGEATSTYYARVWDGYPLGQRAPAACFQELSEILHGRGQNMAAVDWENLSLCEDTMPMSDFSAVLDSYKIALTQICACIFSELRANDKKEKLFQRFMALLDGVKEPEFAAVIPSQLILPTGYLDVTTNSLPESTLNTYYIGAQRIAYAAAPMHVSAQGVIDTFVHRRVKALKRAKALYEFEEMVTGESFHPGMPELKRSKMIFASEMATCLALWYRQSPGVLDLARAGAALRSAYVLWLEDESLCLSCARTALELVARARTRRLKPTRATKIDQAGAAATPRDWFEAAGWSRLTPFTKALGEFAHCWRDNWPAGWASAATTIESIHPEADNGSPEPSEDPALTTRGYALDVVIGFIDNEISERLRGQGTPLCHHYCKLTEIPTPRDLERLLNKSLDLKKSSEPPAGSKSQTYKEFDRRRREWLDSRGAL